MYVLAIIGVSVIILSLMFCIVISLNRKNDKHTEDDEQVQWIHTYNKHRKGNDYEEDEIIRD